MCRITDQGDPDPLQETARSADFAISRKAAKHMACALHALLARKLTMYTLHTPTPAPTHDTHVFLHTRVCLRSTAVSLLLLQPDATRDPKHCNTYTSINLRMSVTSPPRPHKKKDTLDCA